MHHPDYPSLPLWARAAVCYLFLPLVIFALGWLGVWISFPLVACVSASVAAMVFSPGLKTLMRPDRRQIRDGAVIAGIALAFALLTGLCDWVPQSTDYLKHNLILGDLVERPWPVRYSVSGNETYLCYGLGYYMVPAAISKVCGVAHIGVAGFAWAAFGLFLFFIGLGRRFKRLPALGIVTFLLCSGLGACWHIVKSGFVQSLVSTQTDGPWLGERLMDLGLYTSNLDSFTRILYQPQHGIAGWLGGLLIHELLIVRGRWTESASVLAATFFWSPLTSLGLAVIGMAALLTKRRSLAFRPAIHLVAAIAVMCVLSAYYLPHVPIAEKGFIWQMAGGAPWLPWYFLFLLCFVLIPVFSIAWLETKHPYLGEMKPVVIGMTLVLIVSPLFKLGQLGDLRMQISGPAFLFIALAMASGLIEGPARGRMAPYAFLAAVFLAGAMFPVFRTLDNVVSGTKTDYRISTLRKNHLKHITDLRMPGFDVTSQYLGRADSKVAEWILKPADCKKEF